MRDVTREWLGKGDARFAERFPLESLWQTLCENFHVMRADFTRTRFMSEEFASYLMTGRPAMAHRDLSNAIPAMMRPGDRQWLYARTPDESLNNDSTARTYLDWMSDIQFRAMYDPRAKLVRACKEADGDYAAIGNAVFTIEPNQWRDGCMQRCWHPRDVVWAEGDDLNIKEVHHRRKITVRDLCRTFPNSVPDIVKNALAKEPNRKINVRRFVVPTDEYEFEKPLRNKARFVQASVYVDLENDCVLEEIPLRAPTYVIPRWVTISGSQYAYSPAAVLGLPDARMLQQMALTILEAGQKATDPPLKAVAEAITGGVNTGAGMVTWVDPDYDERTGPVLEHLIQKYDGLQYGANREEKVEGTLDAIFFLNQIRMPEITKDMTAFEASKLYEEFQRNSLPLLEPIASDYNGGMAACWFDNLQALGKFGRAEDMPRSLAGQEIRFEFDTPLKAAAEQAKVFKFSQSTDIVAKAMQIDPTADVEFDTHKGLRDAVTATGGAAWLVPPAKAAAALKQKQAAAAAQNTADQMAHGADAASRVATAVQSAGSAAQSLQQGGLG